MGQGEDLRSNGSQPKETLYGNDFKLCIEGDSQSTFGTVTQATTDLDKNCNGVMPPIISRAEAVEMYESFEWENAPVLNDTNDAGLPSLYYMNIFVKDQYQMDMLEALMIHWDTMPLFGDELSKIENMCGTMDTGNLYFEDLQGTWVFAVVPGGVYNAIREAYHSDDVEDDDKIIFEKMILRDYDPGSQEARNYLFESDGSFDYEALVAGGFYYMGLAEMPSEEALDELLQQDKRVREMLMNALQFVAESVRQIVRAVSETLGTITRKIVGGVHLSLDVNLIGIDPLFDQTRTLQKAWGPNGGRELAPEGLHVQFYQWVPNPTAFGVPFLASHDGTTRENGKATFSVAKYGWHGWVCIDYKNNAARITNHITTDRWCAGKIGNEDLNGINSKTEVAINTTNDNFLIMAETMNGKDYAKGVIGYDPVRANILRGPLAGLISGFKQHAMAPTLTRMQSFNSDVMAVIEFLQYYLGNVNPIGYFVDILKQTDIAITNDILHRGGGKTMGLTTHEYGHYVFFSMLSDLGGDSHWIVDRLLTHYIDEQIKGVSDNSDAVIVNEVLADFFATQVVGGANYFCMDESTRALPGGGRHKMAFCRRDHTASPALPCADVNHRDLTTGNCGDPEHFADMMQRLLVEKLHDAVDNDWAVKKGLHPSNADAWTSYSAAPDYLTYTPDSWGYIADEMVSIGGSGIKKLARNMVATSSTSGAVTVKLLELALANEIKSWEPSGFLNPHGSYLDAVYYPPFTWCDACDVFVLHEDGVPVTAAAALGIDDNVGGRYHELRWKECVASSHITELIGDPPHPDLRMGGDCQICPARHWSKYDTNTNSSSCVECEFSNQIVVGNKCEKCQPDEKPVGDVCVPCPDNGYFSSTLGDCVSCEDGFGWNSAAESCYPCQMDYTVYMSNLSFNERCDTLTINETDVSSSGDFCPNELWIEIKELDDTLDDPSGPIVVVRNRVESQLDPMSCAEATTNSSVYYRPAGSTNFSVKYDKSWQGYWDDDGQTAQCSYATSNDILQIRAEDVLNGMTTARIKSTCKMANSTEECATSLYFGSTCMAE